MANEPLVTITGNTGGDPALKFLPSGVAVAEVSVAVTPRDKRGDEWVDGDTMWFRVKVYGHGAETFTDAVTRGARVLVTGRLRQQRWTTAEGVERTGLEVIADGWGLIPKASKAAQGRDTSPWG
jgi:single-strand DNA-binding protein